MDFKHIYSLARKAPLYEALSDRELTLYKAGYRAGYRDALAKKTKPELKIIYKSEDPDRPVVNNVKVVATIFDIILKYFNISQKEILGKGRYRYLVIPRSMITNCIRDCTTLSYPEIARIMYRDHTSIIHHVDAKLKQSSFWKYTNNRQIYGRLKGKVLRETIKD